MDASSSNPELESQQPRLIDIASFTNLRLHLEHEDGPNCLSFSTLKAPQKTCSLFACLKSDDKALGKPHPMTNSGHLLTVLYLLSLRLVHVVHVLLRNCASQRKS